MISRLYAHNFRCLQNFTLDLSQLPTTLLIGKNGVGKSSVLAALECFQQIGRGSGQVKSVVSKEDFFQRNTDEPLRLEIDFSISGMAFNYSVLFDWPENFLQARIQAETLSVNGLPVFNRQIAEVQLPDGRSFTLDWHVFALSVINERPPAKTVGHVKDFFASLVILSPAPAEMSGFAEIATAQVAHNASNFGSALLALLRKYPQSYAHFETQVRETIPDFVSLVNFERGASGTQYVVNFGRQNSTEFSLDFDFLSDGEKCIFLCAYVIAANAAGTNLVCIWDEPDNHLSLSQVGRLILALRKSANRGGQFIATSHHPETIRKFSDENTIVIVRKSHMEPSIPRPLADFKYEGDLVDALTRDEIIG